MFAFTGSLLWLLAAGSVQAERAAFVAEVASSYGIAPTRIEQVLDAARVQPEIIATMSRPAEAKPWSAYRPIFLTAKRIAEGRAFLAEHREPLQALEAKTGVPASLIVAILGVETGYGKNLGKYRSLDALYTLGFHYPPRASFFRKELGELFALAEEEKLDLQSLPGSYAGAMGWGQFMPSSWRRYALDGDGDGKRDLLDSLPDVFASVANYFVVHGWQCGQPVAVPATVDADAEPWPDILPKLDWSLAQLAAKGYRPALAVGADLPAMLLRLEGAEGTEYWLGFANFRVITRYNRSPLYAMAVFQLAEAIAADGDAKVLP